MSTLGHNFNSIIPNTARLVFFASPNALPYRGAIGVVGEAVPSPARFPPHRSWLIITRSRVRFPLEASTNLTKTKNYFSINNCLNMTNTRGQLKKKNILDKTKWFIQIHFFDHGEVRGLTSTRQDDTVLWNMLNSIKWRNNKHLWYYHWL
jgi:hypothetical protein